MGSIEIGRGFAYNMKERIVAGGRVNAEGRFDQGTF
jgi:hypothetical protein